MKTTEINIKNCFNCIYFKQLQSEIGECRINPPAIVESFSTHTHDDDNNELVSYMTRFPIVAEDAWCGRFSAE